MENIIERLKEINTQELDEIEDNKEKENIIKELAKWSQKVINLIERDKNGISKT